MKTHCLVNRETTHILATHWLLQFRLNLFQNLKLKALKKLKIFKTFFFKKVSEVTGVSRFQLVFVVPQQTIWGKGMT